MDHQFLELKWGGWDGSEHPEGLLGQIVSWTHLGNLRIGENLQDPSSPIVHVEITRTGTVTAKEFIGDGSRLTDVPLPDFRTLPALS